MNICGWEFFPRLQDSHVELSIRMYASPLQGQENSCNVVWTRAQFCMYHVLYHLLLLVFSLTYTSSPARPPPYPTLPTLPSHLGQEPIWRLPHAHFPQLVDGEQSQAKGHGQEPMLDGDTITAEVLHTRHKGKNEGDGEGKQDGREQQPVLGEGVEERRVREDTQVAGAQGHDVEPLHDDERDEVDAAGDGEVVGDVVGCLAGRGRDVAEGEPEAAEGQAVARQIPVAHGEGADGLEDTDQAVRLQQQAPVDESVLVDVARRSQHHICLGLFVRQHRCRHTVGETADDDHEETRQHLREPKYHAGHDRPELGKGARGEQVGDGLLEVVEDHAAV